MSAHFYFPGSNTCRGFQGYFDDLLPQGENRWTLLLKGGPGTGKSTLMRAVGAQWEQSGAEVCYYLCASDPDSVDAVACAQCAVIDATLPHALETELPQVSAQVVDLSACLDETVLRAQKKEAQRIACEQRMHTARAHRYLSGAEAAWRDSAAIYAAAVDQGALCNLRLELMQFLQGSAGRPQRLFAQAVTPQGVCQQAESMLRENTICLDLPFGFDADCVLYPLAVALFARGAGYIAAMHPLSGKRIAHIATDTHAVVSFVEKGCDTRTLPFDEAMLKCERSALDFNRAAHDLLLRQAVDSLQEAKQCHDRLERLYRDAMDAGKMHTLTERVLSMTRLD